LDLQTRLARAEEALHSAEQAANAAASECKELEKVRERGGSYPSPTAK